MTNATYEMHFRQEKKRTKPPNQKKKCEKNEKWHHCVGKDNVGIKIKE
jgi:hypothetical protein